MEHAHRSENETEEISLTGKLSFADQNEFIDLITELREASADRWTIDISALTYIDSAGLSLLLRAKSAAEENGKSLRLRIPKNGQVQLMLEASRFDLLFTYA